MKNIDLELTGLERSRKSSLEISADLTDSLVRLRMERLGIRKINKNTVKKLREDLFK